MATVVQTFLSHNHLLFMFQEICQTDIWIVCGKCLETKLLFCLWIFICEYLWIHLPNNCLSSCVVKSFIKYHYQWIICNLIQRLIIGCSVSHLSNSVVIVEEAIYYITLQHKSLVKQLLEFVAVLYQRHLIILVQIIPKMST